MEGWSAGVTPALHPAVNQTRGMSLHHPQLEVAGRGLCHTDVGFANDGVLTRHPLPLILGHEISGRVVSVVHVAHPFADLGTIWCADG